MSTIDTDTLLAAVRDALRNPDPGARHHNTNDTMRDTMIDTRLDTTHDTMALGSSGPPSLTLLPDQRERLDRQIEDLFEAIQALGDDRLPRPRPITHHDRQPSVTVGDGPDSPNDPKQGGLVS